jgi:hypothetical protein
MRRLLRLFDRLCEMPIETCGTVAACYSALMFMAGVFVGKFMLGN